jgi:adenylate cyclase
MTASDSPSERRRPGTAAIVAVLGGLAAALISLLIGEPGRRSIFDLWQQLAPRSISADRVAVVMIDPPSLASVGPWPWPRYYLARLTENIARQKPRVIGFDMIFPESDRLNPDNFASLYPELSEAEQQRLAALPTMDSAFASTIGSAPVVLGRLAIQSDGTDADSVMADPPVVGEVPVAALRYPQILTSIAELDDVAVGHGLLNGPPDDDGVIRTVPLTVVAGDRPMPSFAAELARIAAGAKELRWHGGDLVIGKQRVPADSEGRMRLRFGHFPAPAIHSADEVLAGRLRNDALAGKVVIVGLASEGLADLVSTPIRTEDYGVFSQAQAVDSILSAVWLQRPSWLVGSEWAAGAVLVLLAALGGIHRRSWFYAALAVILSLPLISWFAFDRSGLLFDPLRPGMVGVGAALALQSLLFTHARRDRRRLAAELVEQRIGAARQEGELQAARAIQLGMVPDRARLKALNPRLDIAGLLSPARSVGGDFYDAARLDSDRVLLVIGDVAGKGVPAALFMALSKGLAKSFLTRDSRGIGDAVAALNRELMEEADDSMGVTVLVAVIDCASGSATMVNAGHENPILRRADGRVETIALRGGPPLCVADFPYPEEELTLAAGDALVLVTDGVTEAQDVDGGLFGAARAAQLIEALEHPSATAMVAAVEQGVRTFEGGAEPSDDLTVLAIRYRNAEA